MKISYNNLKVGDVIVFRGANERIVKVWKPTEEIVRFKLEPADERAIDTLGGYATGTYGGNADLFATVIARA